MDALQRSGKMIHLLFIEKSILQISKAILSTDPNFPLIILFNHSYALYRQGQSLFHRKNALVHRQNIQIVIRCSNG